MGVTGGSTSHACLVMGATKALGQCKSKLPQGLVTWKGWLAPKGFVACVEGQIGLVMSVPLP